MKKNWRLLVLTILGLSVLVLGIFIAANQAQISKNRSLGKSDLVAVIEEYQREAKYNLKLFPELLKIAEKANYNREALKTAAYILANAGFHTVPVWEITEIAGNADHEVGHLNDLLEIAIIYGGDTIVNLARQAVNNEISEADLLAQITFYRDHAQAKTIDEAIKMVENDLAGVDRKIDAVIQEIQRQTQNNPQNDQLTAAIKGYMNSGVNSQSLAELLKIAEKAGYNQSVIKTAAEFLSKEGSYHNWPVVSIAKLAGGANREIKQLNGLLEVSIIYGGDSLRIVELAIKAVKNEISEAELEKEIANYRDNSEAKTIDEALENNKKTMAGF